MDTAAAPSGSDRTTPEGTGGYAERFLGVNPPAAAPGHFRTTAAGLRLSSIGLGTYLGEPDDATDERYAASIEQALKLGCNVIDTAINYRFQRSERAIGVAIGRALTSGLVKREELFVSTKGGYVSFDGGLPMHPDEWVTETFVAPGITKREDFVQMHCMAPAYLRHQIAASRRNLRLDCIDLYYLHNPEGQLAAVGARKFAKRMRLAFEELEAAVGRGEIAAYGTATWNGYRRPPSAPDHLSIEAMIRLAREVGGSGHHFRAVQLPLNMAMPEAQARPTQMINFEMRTVLQAAADLGIGVFASASILQGRLAAGLPPEIRKKLSSCRTDAQSALQYARSAPGVTAALVGMSTPDHVRENLELAALPPIDSTSFHRLLVG